MKPNLYSSKPHYEILDGLRGVAALMVVAFHLCEAHAANRFVQVINHGYLAVDFFFLLSGFVIGYAYDDRWVSMNFKGFIRRRLIRLHHMVVMGMIVGLAGFYFQKSELFPLIGVAPFWKVILILLISFTMIPVPPSMDIRGWVEMYPLNGPAWSLFYEYVANILYGTVVRRFSKTALAILVIISGAALVHYTLTGKNGDMIGGWSLEPEQIRIGITRLMFPFFAGLLLQRTAKLVKVNNGFLWCSLLVILVLSLPRFGDADHVWKNGLYESFCIILIFPFIVYIGAGGQIKGRLASGVCKFLGDISYPVYITHYPVVYIYTAWVVNNKPPASTAIFNGVLAFTTSVALAYACLKWYDEPVRRWLAKKLLGV